MISKIKYNKALEIIKQYEEELTLEDKDYALVCCKNMKDLTWRKLYKIVSTTEDSFTIVNNINKKKKFLKVSKLFELSKKIINL